MSASVANAPAPSGARAPAGAAPAPAPGVWQRLAPAAPTLVLAANAVAFFLLRPDVNDLWAARARASAVSHGVGLTYWFSWFGGGTTPGNYSVLTPSLSAALGCELVVAVAAVAVTALGTVAVRHTRRPLAAAWVLAVVTAANLWSGRVPFLLGAAFALGALLALQRRHRTGTVLLTVLAVLSSPVPGAFLVLGLSGTFITTRTREWRPIIAWCASSALVAALAVALVFGTPGPEPFGFRLALGTCVGLALLYLARPADHLRTTILWSFPIVLAVFALPNGMGSNVTRFVWFCLPVAVVATSTRGRRLVALLLTPVVAAGVWGTVRDLRSATLPISSVGFYQPLATELDRIPDVRSYRVEVVNHGAHAAYDALLDHALLARGWETQADTALNRALHTDPLDATTYKVWLDNNAVGYVALPAVSVSGYSEYDLVRSGRAGYLRPIWRSTDWTLYEVTHPTPIAGAPARVVRHSQSALTVSLPCRCTVNVRVRYSKFLQATLERPNAGRRQGAATRRVTATLRDDGTGWTTLAAPRPGRYTLTGSIDGFLH